VSGGIHLVNYLYDAVCHGGHTGVAGRAVKLGWVPCALSSGTTAIGLASLMVSDIVPIRQFGFYGAFGVSATFVMSSRCCRERLRAGFNHERIRRRLRRTEPAGIATDGLHPEVCDVDRRR
jgi:predicted RND superfamily exporter protein